MATSTRPTNLVPDIGCAKGMALQTMLALTLEMACLTARVKRVDGQNVETVEAATCTRPAETSAVQNLL